VGDAGSHERQELECDRASIVDSISTKTDSEAITGPIAAAVVSWGHRGF